MDSTTKKDLLIALAILLLIFGLWIITGGPSRSSSKQGPFLDLYLVAPQLPNIQNGDESKNDDSISAYKYRVALGSSTPAKESDIQKEYIEIRASSKNEGAINISNWSLENQNGIKVKIEQVAILPILGEINKEQDVFLGPGEKTIIATGRSPLGASFQINKCMGYLSKMQDFYPKLTVKCPHPIDDELLPASLDNQCIDYIDKEFELCRTYITLPSTISSDCREYINERINYNGCVRWHKKDSDFYRPEYRIYLKRNSELWTNDHGKIILYDENNKIIDWISY